MKSSNTEKPHYCYSKLHRDCVIKEKFIVNTGFGLCEYCMWTVGDKLETLQGFLLLTYLIDSFTEYKKINISTVLKFYSSSSSIYSHFAEIMLLEEGHI